MKRLLVVGAVLAAVVITAFAALPLTAGAHSDKRFVIAIRGNLTGDTNAAGTFAGDGGISGSGTLDSTFTAKPIRSDCFAINADWMFTAADGTFAFHGSGRSCSSSPGGPRAISDFKFTITGGTGAYAGLAGKGTATGVTDFEHEGAVTTVFDGTVRAAH
jgi:hypothetical protein